MNYTNYIINGKIIDVDSLISSSKNDLVNKSLIPVASAIAIIGVVVLASALPLTLSIDGVRQMKAICIKGMKRYHTKYVFILPMYSAQSQLRTLIETKSNKIVFEKYKVHNETNKVYKKKDQWKPVIIKNI
jgi:hypothetical protein